MEKIEVSYWFTSISEIQILMQSMDLLHTTHRVVDQIQLLNNEASATMSGCQGSLEHLFRYEINYTIQPTKYSA